MSNWQIKKLSDISNIGAGNSAPQKKELFKNGRYPFFRTSDVGKFRITKSIVATTDSLNEEGVKKMKLHTKGTILLPKSGASTFLNHRVVMGVDGYVSSHLATIKVDKKLVDKYFLFYFLQIIRAQDLIQDHKYPSLNLSVISNIQIPLPPLPEQKRIVALLDEIFKKLENAKENAEKNLKNAKKLLESCIESTFDSLIGECTEAELGEKATFRNGINFTKGSKGELVKIVGVKDFQSNFLIPLNDLQFVTTDGELKEIDVLKQNDILVVRSNGNPKLIGRCILAGNIADKITHSGFTIRIRLDSEEISSEYFCHYLKSQIAKKHLIESGTGINIKSLNQKSLSSLIIPIPSLTVQKNIVSKLNELYEHTKKLELIYGEKQTQLDALKQSILNQAFTGKL